jgi:hypothetical protein
MNFFPRKVLPSCLKCTALCRIDDFGEKKTSSFQKKYLEFFQKLAEFFENLLSFFENLLSFFEIC